ncbi:MAG: hypothetical protein V5783_09470 [Pontiella sp.]
MQTEISGPAFDAQYGPLLYLAGDEVSRIELTCLPAPSKMKAHAVATRSDSRHEVVLKGIRTQKQLMMLGYHPGVADEISCPIFTRSAVDIKRTHLTDMPDLVCAAAQYCTLITEGSVEQHDGSGIEFFKK